MRQMVDSVAGAARQYGSVGRQNCAGTEQREERSLVPVPKEFQSKALISSRKQVRNQFLLFSISENFEVLFRFSYPAGHCCSLFASSIVVHSFLRFLGCLHVGKVVSVSV